LLLITVAVILIGLGLKSSSRGDAENGSNEENASQPSQRPADFPLQTPAAAMGGPAMPELDPAVLDEYAAGNEGPGPAKELPFVIEEPGEAQPASAERFDASFPT